MAQQAAQAVMTRHLVNGTIKLDFEKLDPQTLTYGPMTDEEKAPYLENFNKAINAVNTGTEQPPVVAEPEVKEAAKIITM
jgi:hypothetical protein